MSESQKCWTQNNHQFKCFQCHHSCHRCNRMIQSNEFIIKINSNLKFHLQCFSCQLCGSILSKGDRFSIIDGRIICAKHNQIINHQPINSHPNSSPQTSSSHFNSHPNSQPSRGRGRGRGKKRDL